MVANGPTAVYPGHPLTLAAIIASLYPSLGAAHERNGSDTPAALADIRIPGAGGKVVLHPDQACCTLTPSIAP